MLPTVLCATLYYYNYCAANLDPVAIYQISGLLVSEGEGEGRTFVVLTDDCTHGSKLTAVASVIKGKTGGVGSELTGKNKKGGSTFRHIPSTHSPRYQSGEGQVDHHSDYFPWLKNPWRHSQERRRLRVADLGVAGGGRVVDSGSVGGCPPWLPAAMLDRKVEK